MRFKHQVKNFLNTYFIAGKRLPNFGKAKTEHVCKFAHNASSPP